MKATEQVVLPVVLFTLLSKVVLGNSSCNTVYYVVQGGSSFRDCCWNPRGLPFKKNNYRTVLSCSTAYYAVQGGTRFWDCWWMLEGYHSNESNRAVLSCGTIYFAVQGGTRVWCCSWIPEGYHSNESYRAVLSCGTITLLYKVVLAFESEKGRARLAATKAWQSSLPRKSHTWCLVSPDIFCDKSGHTLHTRLHWKPRNYRRHGI